MEQLERENLGAEGLKFRKLNIFNLQLDQELSNTLIGKSRALVRDGLRERDPGKIVHGIHNSLKILAKYKNMELFQQGMFLLAEYNAYGGDFANAFFVYNLLRVMSAVQNNTAMRIMTFLKMAECATLSRDYLSSNRFYKKALQYIWLTKNEELEVLVYDKLGQNFFQIGNMEKASYYHQRSVNSLKESPQSSIKISSEQSTKQYLESQKFIYYQTFDQELLKRIGMLDNSYKPEGTDFQTPHFD